MATSLHFVAYASSATHQLSAQELVDLLAVCRANNIRDDLTGMLLYRGGNFLQALEGPAAGIRAAMERITRDPRHRSVVLLCDEVQTERVFGEWSMGFADAEKLDPAEHPGLSYFLSQPNSAGASASSEHDVMEFFHSFRTHVT